MFRHLTKRWRELRQCLPELTHNRSLQLNRLPRPFSARSPSVGFVSSHRFSRSVHRRANDLPVSRPTAGPLTDRMLFNRPLSITLAIILSDSVTKQSNTNCPLSNLNVGPPAPRPTRPDGFAVPIIALDALQMVIWELVSEYWQHATWT